MLKIGGVQRFSTLDYPGKMSAVLFLQGCQWACEFCHNVHLQPIQSAGIIDFESVLPWLETRKGKLDAVVFSGGEPLLQSNLPLAIEKTRLLGFKIGLHTSGSLPKRLAEVLPLTDWVGFDFKHLPHKMPGLVHSPDAGERTAQALSLLATHQKPFEIRTTVHSKWHNQEDLIEMAGILGNVGIKEWILQTCRPEGCPTPIQKEAPQVMYPELKAEAAKRGVSVVFRSA